MRSTFAVASDSVLSAWQWFLAHARGKPVILKVACVDPAALGGGTGDLDPYPPTATQIGLTEQVPTPWVTHPGLYSANCKQGGGTTWLQVTCLRWGRLF
jgi:hypothetical protein